MDWMTGTLRDGPVVDAVLVQQSQRTFMARVYQWMFAGLALTGGVALYTATNAALFSFVMHSYWLLMIVQLGLVFGLSFGVNRLSGAVAGALFLAYSALMGLSLSGIFFAYHLGTIFQAFFVSAAAFAALSIYGTVTKKDLSAWGSFLFIGLFGLVIASVVNMFMHSDGLDFVLSCVAVVVFGGLTAYDNQKLRQMHAMAGYPGSASSLAVVGALQLYLDFINLFIALVRLFARSERR